MFGFIKEGGKRSGGCLVHLTIWETKTTNKPHMYSKGKEYGINRKHTCGGVKQAINCKQSEYFPLALARVVSSLFFTIVVLVPQRHHIEEAWLFWLFAMDCSFLISPPATPYMYTCVCDWFRIFSNFVLLCRFYFSHRLIHEAPPPSLPHSTP